MEPTNDQKRFMLYVNKEENGCWKWCGSRAITGYCNFFYKGKTFLAHRAALLIFGKVKELTPGLLVCHTCTTKGCVNPDHLNEATRSVNNGIDRVRDGTDCSGDKCHFAKLTWEKVNEIRKRYTDGEKQKTIAADYSVSIGTVSGIVREKTWVRK